MKSLYGVATLPCHQTRQCNMFDFTLLTFLLLKNFTIERLIIWLSQSAMKGS